jgi:hypothetical protein
MVDGRHIAGRYYYSRNIQISTVLLYRSRLIVLTTSSTKQITVYSAMPV